MIIYWILAPHGGSALSDLDVFVLSIFDLVGILILILYTRPLRSSEVT